MLRHAWCTEEVRTTLRRELDTAMQGRKNPLPSEVLDHIFQEPPGTLLNYLEVLAIEYGASRHLRFPPRLRDDIPPSELILRVPPLIDTTQQPTLISAIEALEEYNKFLEKKTAKFNVQTVRSLALMQKSSPAIARVPAPDANTTESKLRQVLHVMEVEKLKDRLDATDKTQSLKLLEYSTIYSREIRLLACYNEYFKQTFNLDIPPPGTVEGWPVYDRLLKHVDEWTRVVFQRPAVINSTVIKSAHDLVEHVVHLLTDHCKTQLATVYHETAAVRTGPPSDHRNAIRQEAEALATEIDWLMEELVPVAQMCVSSQFLRPLVGATRAFEQVRAHREATITTYTSGVMRFMHDHLEAVVSRTEILVYHHQALRDASYLRPLYKAGPSDMVPKGPPPRTKAQDIRSFRKNATASENLMYYMKLYAPAPLIVPSIYAPPAPSVLRRFVHDRAEKGDKMLKDMHILFEVAVKACLTDRELGGELLLESLLADSSPDPAEPGSAYKDSELERSIEVLRGQAQQVQQMFKELNLDGIANAPDFVAHAYRQNAERLDAKVGEDCFRHGENKRPSCLTCVRCLKFEQFLRRWSS
ncbi:hypothetical protein F5Y17DRAFT_283571 [Xylariaceae sp. FL0594]|nr:hypothetical protein F5Y17DRAFT_283571 [Xylariaceae sp. FL0594]